MEPNAPEYWVKSMTMRLIWNKQESPIVENTQQSDKIQEIERSTNEDRQGDTLDLLWLKHIHKTD